MEKLGHKLFGALKILKEYPAHKCSHRSKPVTGSECFLSMLGDTNVNHYLIATQDRDLQDKVRAVPGVPLIYLHIKTPVLEEPSQVSKNFAREKMLVMWHSKEEVLAELKMKNGLIIEDDIPKQKKKKRGPNPLSCKKKKKKCSIENPSQISSGKSEIHKRKRKKIRIPEHVKQELIKNKSFS